MESGIANPFRIGMKHQFKSLEWIGQDARMALLKVEEKSAKIHQF